MQDDFSLRNLFGDHGAAFLEAVGARRCIHPLAAAMSILGALAPLANGAGVRLWSDPSPLCVAIVLINAAQSRKSVNSHTSTLNRFLQTGSASRLTRTAGAYGGVAALPVSFGLVGNAHPAATLAMLEGSTGIQVAATHERILFYTCPWVQPHEKFSASVPVVGPRFLWTSFPPELAEFSGLTALLRDPERASHSGRKRAVRGQPNLQTWAKAYTVSIFEYRGLTCLHLAQD